MDMQEKPQDTLSQGDISSLIEAASDPNTEAQEPEEKTEIESSPEVADQDALQGSIADETGTPEEPSNTSGSSEMNSQYSVNIQRVLDINLPVTVSFGSTKRSLSEVLKLAPGALLELDKAAEEPVVLKVNNKVFAWGQVVDADGYYGVEITNIVAQADRIFSLGES
jgi:flagellar motor switch protein FliN/FliY